MKVSACYVGDLNIPVVMQEPGVGGYHRKIGVDIFSTKIVRDDFAQGLDLGQNNVKDFLDCVGILDWS